MKKEVSGWRRFGLKVGLVGMALVFGMIVAARYLHDDGAYRERRDAGVDGGGQTVQARAEAPSTPSAAPTLSMPGRPVNRTETPAARGGVPAVATGATGERMLNADALPQQLTGDNFQKAIAKGVYLVDFWADWCGPCHIQAPAVDLLANAFAGRAGVGKLNIDASRDVSRQLGISAIPTIIIFKDGKEIRRFVGVQQETTLTAALNAQLR